MQLITREKTDMQPTENQMFLKNLANQSLYTLINAL